MNSSKTVKMFYHVVFLVFLVVISHAIPIQPMPPGQGSDTILAQMRTELRSSFGSCSFPPEEVLGGLTSEDFRFLETCNKTVLNSNYKDKDTLLCMGLFDVGLRICGADKNTFTIITHHMPHTAGEFLHLLTKGLDHPQTDLCKALKDTVGAPQYPSTRNWNLKAALEKSDHACSRLCYDYSDNENVFCKLILWGSNLLTYRPPVEDSAVSLDNKGADPASPIDETQEAPMRVKPMVSKPSASRHLGISQTNSKEAHLNHGPYSSSSGVGVPSTGLGVKTDDSADPGNPSQSSDIVVEPSQNVSPISGNTGSAMNGGKSGIVEIVESKGPIRTQQKLPSVLDETKTDPQYGLQTKQTNPTLAREHGGPTVSKTVTNEATGQSQKAVPDVVEVKSHESSVPTGLQEVVKPSTIPAKSKTSSATAGSTSAVEAVPQDVPIPNEAGDIGGDEEAGVEQFGNEQPFQGDEDDDQSFPNNEFGFDAPSKSENTLGNGNYGKQPQEEMSNGNAYVRDRFEDSEDSHFFSYFLVMIVICIVGYLVFHNKQKILALALEGRARRGSRRRPNTANYHKLDSNLEEAVSSPCNTSTTHVIY